MTLNLYQDVFFRSLDLLRGRRTIERLKFLRKSQYWDRGELQKWQLDRLNDLLIQAKNNSPYYREKLRNVELPFSSLGQMESIPIITKRDIKDNGEIIRSTNLPNKRFVPSRTGGSTGEPMHYFWDKRGMDWNRASVYRSGEWANVHLGEHTVQMSGSRADFNQMQKLQWKLIYLLQRYRDLPVAYMSDNLLEKYFNVIQRFKPTSIWGYASGIYEFARYLQEAHPDTQYPYIKALITSSENLGEKRRELINKVFGVGKVFDNYGSREIYIGAECNQHDGYHIHSEIILLEILDKENKRCKPGELGRVVLTDLSNHAFPFIRYENGDVGTMAEEHECQCGVMLPKLKSIDGRIVDTIVLPDRKLTAVNFSLIFSDKKGIRSYQIVQDDMNTLKVLVVPDKDFSSDVRKYIRDSLVNIAGDNVTLNIEEVDDIPVPESGKRRYVISNISKDLL